MKTFRTNLKRLSPVVVVIALVAGQAAVANAAPSGISVSPSDPTLSATSVTYTWTWTGYQTSSAVKCAKVVYSANADGTGGKPSGMTVSGTTLAGTMLAGQSFAADDTNAGTGSVVYNNSTGVTPGAGPRTITIAGITNPSSAGTIYINVTTYDTDGNGSSGNCGGSVLDAQTFAAVAITANTTVSVTVDPSFSFTVANQASACNGESQFVSGAGTATTVALGHLAVSSNASGGQALTVSGNSGGGFSVYVRGTQASTPLRSAGHNWLDVSGTYASPAVLGGTEGFGYTILDSTTSSSVTAFGSANFAKLDNATTNKIMGSTTSTSGNGCISYDAKTGAATPAGSYTATVIYTAVPTF